MQTNKPIVNWKQSFSYIGDRSVIFLPNLATDGDRLYAGVGIQNILVKKVTVSEMSSSLTKLLAVWSCSEIVTSVTMSKVVGEG